MSLLLMDRYGKDQKFDHDKIFVRDENGELVQFTQGTGEPTLEALEVTENGTYTPGEGVDGFNSVEVNVAGSSADVRYVTFMSHDGLTEYGKKAVAVGDDCADPIARGIFGTPTRESDAQYNYTHNGWATEQNGSADADWNKSITEDNTVYASFAADVRYYTITYYDSDGVKVLKTESLPYGAIPEYIPTNDDYSFDGWTPALSVVTGNASYIVKWAEKPSFAGSSWAKLSEVSESGKASEYFKVGDTKIIDFTASDGTIYKVTLAIADFNHDPLASDASVMAGMTIDCTVVPNETTAWASTQTNGCHPLNANYIIDDFLQTVKTQLPEELQAVIKTIKKTVRNSASNTTSYSSKSYDLFPYTLKELGLWTSSNAWEGELYPLFETEANRIAKNMDTGEAVKYWSHSVGQESTYYIKGYYVGADGTYSSYGRQTLHTTQLPVKFGFCI